MTQDEQIEQLEDKVADLKAMNEVLEVEIESRKKLARRRCAEAQRLREAHEHTLRAFALVLRSLPGGRVEIRDETVADYDPNRTNLCIERSLARASTSVWVEVDNNKETSP